MCSPARHLLRMRERLRLRATLRVRPHVRMLREEVDSWIMIDEAKATLALVENHRAFLRFLERRLGRRDVAEDILQEAFVRGMDGIGALREDESVIPWFYRMLRNAVIDHHRRSGAADRALAQLAHEMEQSEEPLETIREEACACVTRLAETLKPEYADALRRVEIDGVAVKDFAEEQNITASNAAVRVFRARGALRKQLVKSCGTCATHGCLDCSCGH